MKLTSLLPMLPMLALLPANFAEASSTVASSTTVSVNPTSAKTHTENTSSYAPAVPQAPVINVGSAYRKRTSPLRGLRHWFKRKRRTLKVNLRQLKQTWLTKYEDLNFLSLEDIAEKITSLSQHWQNADSPTISAISAWKPDLDAWVETFLDIPAVGHLTAWWSQLEPFSWPGIIRSWNSWAHDIDIGTALTPYAPKQMNDVDTGWSILWYPMRIANTIKSCFSLLVCLYKKVAFIYYHWNEIVASFMYTGMVVFALVMDSTLNNWGVVRGVARGIVWFVQGVFSLTFGMLWSFFQVVGWVIAMIWSLPVWAFRKISGR